MPKYAIAFYDNQNPEIVLEIVRGSSYVDAVQSSKFYLQLLESLDEGGWTESLKRYGQIDGIMAMKCEMLSDNIEFEILEIPT